MMSRKWSADPADGEMTVTVTDSEVKLEVEDTCRGHYSTASCPIGQYFDQQPMTGWDPFRKLIAGRFPPAELNEIEDYIRNLGGVP